VLAAVGVERVLENAHHERARIAREDVLGTVAMVHVEVHHGHALQVVALQRVLGGNGDVVEKAKPHGLVARGVVAGRAHGAKGVFDLARHDRVGGRDGRARRTQRRRPGVGVDGGVRVYLRVWRATGLQVFAQPVVQAAQRRDVQPRVRQLDVGQRRGRAS